MEFHRVDLQLQLIGIFAEHYTPGAVGPIGPSIQLPTGSFSEPDHPLGVCNLSAVDLPEALLDANWLLTGYELKGPNGACRLRLTDAQRMNRVQLPLIPAGCLQPMTSVQPTFTLSTLMRNPCPGWNERIFLYSNPDKPFEATSVIYTDVTGRIAAVELFDTQLRHTHHPVFQRIWVALNY